MRARGALAAGVRRWGSGGPSLCRITTHYDVLGVPPDASAATIRAAYRDRARRYHPDRAADSSEVMSTVNEAYRILGDPGRRALYDRSLLGGPPTSSLRAPDVDADVDVERPRVPRPSPLSPDGPARLPWKLMLVTAVIGSAVVLAAAALTDPPSEEPPDGIIQAGSCVAIEPNGDAREIACTGEGDVVVKYLVPTGGRCPAGTMAYRDRLGLGTVCTGE